MNISPTLEANAKTTEIVEPRMSAFDHPAKAAKTATVFGSVRRFAITGLMPRSRSRGRCGSES